MTSRPTTLLAILLLLLVSIPSFSQPSGKDPKLLALFMYKFTEHITWPTPTDKKVVGILGAPDVYEELKKLEARNPRLSVVEVSSLEEAADLHVLFLCSAMKSEYRAYTKGLSKGNTLIVCEDRADWRLGIDIAFQMANDRLSYFIDKGHLERRGLVASQRLLGLGG